MHTVRKTISAQSAVLIKVLTDQFKGLGLVVEIDNWRASCFRIFPLEVMLLARETEDLQGNNCEVPRPGDLYTVSNQVHRQLQVVFCDH